MQANSLKMDFIAPLEDKVESDAKSYAVSWRHTIK